ncbi:MAG: NfeD family protein [Sphingomonas sp.]|uniref:NfeD family protein n=1 Tax=Sphingomonas sp. TaxID=28214 RepID=UPI001ACD9782|nr:NfeD family protein [Sphingomonas sp.]MBN8814810.1 NfeD family protein [Sphingomonas sp.]
MTIFGIDFSMGALWLAAALVLAILEVVAPGFFMIFLALGAAITGFVMLIAPGLHLIVQALLFALFTAGAVALGRRWYHRSPSTVGPPGMNDRTANLIGRVVEVCEPIVGGEGRVKVGDGAWAAKGADMPAGARVKITGAAGSVLLVEPLA